ncbi:UNVERIFIED_CONTAM: hypothetical protein PYX00_009450 [Menopon gallinae]|uniref:CRAL-TRIO domain-containing protein n=1 Tax=Menopon gallinae TaxID=328185 RepID=A0AAW2HB30_9NEOP
MELLGRLNPEDLKAALDSIGETESKLQQYRQLVKDWMKCQPHLPSDKYDEDIIDIFIRGCKFNLERIKYKLDNYFTVRTVSPELFGDWNPCGETLKEAMKNFTVIPLPIPLSSGYRVVLHKYLSADTSTFVYRDIVTLMLMTSDIRLREEPPLLGDVFIFDVANFSAGHLTKFSIPVLRKALQCTQVTENFHNRYPQRLKEIHMINAPVVVDKLVNLFKQFMKEKMRNRFHIHSQHETLYKFVPPSHLPKDYGGELESLGEFQSRWQEKLASYKTYFLQQANIKSDETKRKENSNGSAGDVYGCEGAFRKLDVN